MSRAPGPRDGATEIRVTEIRVDLDTCVGAGMCALTAPESFDQDEEDGRVVVRNARPGPDEVTAVEEAVSLCPSGAITCVTLSIAGESGRSEPAGEDEPGA